MCKGKLTLCLGVLVTCTCVWLAARTQNGSSSSASFVPGSLKRPPITGIAHVSLYVSDPAKAEGFYGHVLGFAHFSSEKADGLLANDYKINDRQYIEIYAGLQGDDQDRLSHIAFETTDAQAMRRYLASKKVGVPRDLKADPDGNLSFKIEDPEGRQIEFVQYVPGSVQLKKKGALLPATRVSNHMIHSGFIVHDRAAEDSLYKDILGFQPMWYGGMTDNEVRWVDMRVPEGSDWLEYMLRVDHPNVKVRGVMNHLALGVPNIQVPYHTILGRDFKLSEVPKVGRDGKWQLNLYDPDQTRIEMMELKPVAIPCCSPMLSQ